MATVEPAGGDQEYRDENGGEAVSSSMEREEGRKSAAADSLFREDEGDDDEDGTGHDGASAQLPFEPKAPERSPPPAIFKAWQQDKYGTMMMQAVLQDDAESLTWMLKHNLVDLAATDDLGNTAAHLAVFHDSPRVLRLLHELGLDLAATCDSEEFGSAIFYSAYLGRVECLEELIDLGYDMSPPCDRFGRTPETVAERHDQGGVRSIIRRSLVVLHIQRLTRGFLGRQKAKRIKAAGGRGANKEAERTLLARGGGDDGEVGVEAGGVGEEDGRQGAELAAVGGADDATAGGGPSVAL
ncbi:unnamed protein product [Ectocarpus sp. 12 AP-2014]